jgi:hypothetical protein
MRIENELVEFVKAEEQEYDGVIEEYEEEILVQEKFPEPPVTNTTDSAPAQGKPWCITFNIYIYIYICVCVCVCVCVCCASMLHEFDENHMHIYIYL